MSDLYTWEDEWRLASYIELYASFTPTDVGALWAVSGPVRWLKDPTLHLHTEC